MSAIFRLRHLILLLSLCAISSGCATHAPRTVKMEVTAYCGCGQCCDWERGRWLFLKLNFWNRYVSRGPRKGLSYSGRTAMGTEPREAYPGLFSLDSLVHPYLIPFRILLFPWLFLPQEGTIAADTDYYPFGTRMHIPGYGDGVVEDRGGAIKGPQHIDIYFDSHRDALLWGRQRLQVRIEP